MNNVVVALGTDQLERMATVLGTVAFVFLFAAAIMWLLQRSGVHLNAAVRTTFQKFGINVSVSGSGFMGSYLALVIATFSAVYLVAKFILK